MQAIQPGLIVLKAPGGLEVLVTSALTAAGLRLVVVNPHQARIFAKATLEPTKSDALAAWALAHVAEAVRPALRPLPDAPRQALSARLTQRRQLVEMLTAEKNRVARAPGAIRADIQAHITWLEQRLADLDTDIGRAIRASPLWREHDDLLQSTPGVGPVLSRTLLDDLPEQGIVSRQQMAASVGVAPLNRDSGTLWGKRIVWGGRVIVRGVLYMGNLIAVHLILCSKPSISGCTP